MGDNPTFPPQGEEQAERHSVVRVSRRALQRRPLPRLTGKQREKLSKLFSTNISSSSSSRELGHLLPQMRAALEVSGEANRLEAVVAALGAERVIAPMPVEKRTLDSISEANDTSRGGGRRESHTKTLASEAEVVTPITVFPSVPTILGQAVCVFSSEARFSAWQQRQVGEHRPVPMGTQKVALTSLAADISALIVDPGSKQPVLVPHPAVEALAVAGKWLPPWKDTELQAELEQLAKAQFGGQGIGFVCVEPLLNPAHSRLWLMQQEVVLEKSLEKSNPVELATAVAVALKVGVEAGSQLGENPRELAKVLALLSRAPRLRSNTWLVEFQPQLVTPV